MKKAILFCGHLRNIQDISLNMKKKILLKYYDIYIHACDNNHSKDMMTGNDQFYSFDNIDVKKYLKIRM